MNVYVLHHYYSDWDFTDTEIRGVFATQEAADASIGATEADGKTHDEDCCSVQRWAVDTEPLASYHGPFRSDLRMPTTSPRLVSELVARRLEEQLRARGPYGRLPLP